MHQATIHAALSFIFIALSLTNLVKAADNLDHASAGELNLYLALAKACEQVYDDSYDNLIVTPSGCVLSTQTDSYGNLIVAFRGSMLADRNPKHPFSSFSGANLRRNYRDWAATNVKQAFGFLPRQYIEAIDVLEKLLIQHPIDKYVFVTGHSKGGGIATYASVVVRYSADIRPEHVQRLRTFTFNAAVVREQNWRRFFRRLDPDLNLHERKTPPGSIVALCMRDDPVSKIAALEERDYVRRITITPSAELSPNEQHGILAIINELGKRRAMLPTP